MIINTELEQKGNLFPSAIKSYKKDVDKLYFITKNNVVLQVTVIRDSVIRFRYATTGKFDKDFSYGITMYASRGYNQLKVTEDETHYSIATSKLICKVKKENLHVSLYDALDLKLINEDEMGFHWEESYEFGGDIVKMSKICQKSESFYGLGDKPVGANIKGKRFENWVTDAYAFGKDTDPIYKAIPFYTAVQENKAYGIFFDNTFKTHFDFAQERRNVTSFWADGGEMNYYFIYGPQMQDVVANYTDLTSLLVAAPNYTTGVGSADGTAWMDLGNGRNFIQFNGLTSFSGGTMSQTLFLKYRPQNFADLVGQQSVVKTLKNALAKNNPAHAYLFVGSRGTGKTSSANRGRLSPAGWLAKRIATSAS